MAKDVKISFGVGNSISSYLYLVFCVLTSMVGYTIHKSYFYSVMDLLFAPVVWLKWLLFKEVTLQIIKSTFDWFF